MKVKIDHTFSPEFAEDKYRKVYSILEINIGTFYFVVDDAGKEVGVIDEFVVDKIEG